MNEDFPLELNFPQHLYDDWIRDKFAEVQIENRGNLSRTIHVSFAKCEWVSPFPVLALIAELITFSAPNRSILVDLGDGAGSDKGALSRLRALKFLSLHGFLDSFTTRADITVSFQFDLVGENGAAGNWYIGTMGLRELRRILDRIPLELIYGDQIVIPSTVWLLPPRGDRNLTETIRTKVSELLKYADAVLYRFKTQSRKYRDVTLQRLNQVLLELVENSAEHAYDDKSIGYVGIYARVRMTDNEHAADSRKKEFMRSPLLSKILLSEKQQQIELFILDVGKGLFSDIATWRGGEYAAMGNGQPLRETASILFAKPVSRHSRLVENVSQLRGGSTGLVHLDSILRHQNDSTRIVTGREWLAGSHPRPSGFQDNAVSSGGYIMQDKQMAGTFFHLGISPSMIPDLNVQWFSSDKKTNEQIRSSVIEKFARAKPRTKFLPKVIDIRNGDGLDTIQLRVKDAATSLSGTIVRVNRIAEKNLINRIVISWIQGSAASTRSSSTLYLCDLGRYQAIDCVWVIEHLFSDHQRMELMRKPENLTILLVTEDLCCTTLPVTCKQRRDGKFQINIGRQSATIPKLDNRLVYLLEELRVRDSAELWQRATLLSVDGEPNPVLLQNVQWDSTDSNRILPFYINFAVLIQDEEAARCIRRSLRRLLALFPHAHGLAVDVLVGASLHDAMKWLILPPQESIDRILVGSLSVSGSTLQRYRKPLNTKIVGLIDCIRTPYFELSNNYFNAPHLAALLWNPEFETDTALQPQFRRVGRSAYVESIGTAPRQVFYDENMYQEIESAQLVKVGHWAYGDCHGLLEINTHTAIDQSGASESGAITWLVAEMAKICEKSNVILAFPVDKLAYRLAHHVKYRLKKHDPVISTELTLLPLSYIPQIAGGLKRFVPLVVAAAKTLAIPRNGIVPVVVFLDIGYITNRTVRHSVRQLKEAGFSTVHAMGVLNRSSAPELPSENLRSVSGSTSFPRTYWRWNVPVLGIAAHCKVCSAMPAIGRLAKIIRETHVDLIPWMTEISDAWIVREITDAWDEYGITPRLISDKVHASISPILEKMFIIKGFSSSTLAARVIEYLRSTGDPSTITILVRQLIEIEEQEHAIEVLSVVLLLAGEGLSTADTIEFLVLLIQAAIKLSGKSSLPALVAPSERRLIGLTVFVFASASAACKVAVLPDLVNLLSYTDIVNSSSLRVALIALTTDSDVHSDIQTEFSRMCTASKNITLLHNYQSLRPMRGDAYDSWYKLTQAFGRSSGHSQQSELGYIRLEFSRSESAKNSVPRIRRIASLLAQCDQNFVMNTLGSDIQELIGSIQQAEQKILAMELNAAEFNELIDSVFNDISGKLHRTLVRYGDRAKSPLIYNVFFDILEKQARDNGLALMSDLVPTSQALTAQWPPGIGDYLPLGEQISRLLGEIFYNIRGKSKRLVPPPSLSQLVVSSTPALAWFRFNLDYEPLTKGITVEFITGLNSTKFVSSYNPKVTSLSDFGVIVNSEIIEHDYFSIRIRIPSFASILEKS